MRSYFDIIKYLQSIDQLIQYSGDNWNVSDITFDSRTVIQDSIFICKGLNFNKKFIYDALNNGARAIISEERFDIDIPFIQVKDIRETMLHLARFFFDYPDTKLKLIGVTGTKGKSTTVNMLKEILDYSFERKGKKKVGLISGITIFTGKNTYDSKLTTPEAIDYFRFLKECVDNNLEYVIVEISSQALKLKRITNSRFDKIGFLNFSIDHVGTNEHPSYGDYLDSKLKVFELSDHFVVSTNTEEFESIYKKSKNKNVIYYGTNDKSNFLISNINSNIGKSTFKFLDTNFEINIEGKYNIENCACAILLAKDYVDNIIDIKQALKNIEIKSRTELLISKDEKIVTYVNYSHNKVSFENNLEMLTSMFPGYEIISIFGSVGDKAQNRREDLPKAAQKYSNKIYFVPDDPGTEDHYLISKEMESHLTDIDSKIFNSREEAIEYCFKNLGGKTVLFIAGKGSETFQKVGGGVR